MLRSFPKGGIHPPDNKLSASAAIETAALPEVVVVPLSQHIGTPAVAEVEKGDKVITGQLIAKARGFVSAAVHSPVSGVVTAVGEVPNAAGVKTMCVTIKVEDDRWLPSIDRSPDLVTTCTLTGPQIIEKIAEAGIVGMGGATFPTQVKLATPPGKKAEVLIINGVECEPYLTSDHRVMLERGAEVLVGVGLMARATGSSKIFVGIENNKADAIANLRHAAGELGSALPDIEIVALKVQYPQGSEKQLIKALTDREVPSGALPVDVGCVVVNVSTALAVYEAVQKNKPLIDRVVTVTGKNLVKPSNFLARIGTPVSFLIEAAGGMTGMAGASENAEPDSADGSSGGVQQPGYLKIISGGPMMGRAMSNPDAPVIKGTSGVVVVSPQEALRDVETDCIKCANCVSACPMGLEPYLLSRLMQKSRWDELEAAAVTDCISCGSCSFICPARIPLLDRIRLGKIEVNNIIRARRNS